MTMMEIGQRHSGTLFVTPDGAGLRADIQINDDFVLVMIDGGESFRYGRDQVRAQVFDSRTVLLDITDDEDLYFSADNPFRFTELAMPELQDGATARRSHVPADPDAGGDERAQHAETASVAPTRSRRTRSSERGRRDPAAASTTDSPRDGAPSDGSDKHWKLPVIGTTLPARAEPSRVASSTKKKQRRRGGDRTTCQHEWRSLNLSAGLVRKVCEDCGYVSIDITG
jgi:hypothetical protein